MALLETYGPTNLDVYEPETTQTYFVAFEALAGIWYNIYNDVTTARYAYVGMTKAAAITCAAAVSNPSAGINARVVRASGGAMYNVEVDKCSITTWQEAV